jgi:iron complex transport system ATP-binding protein
MQAKDLWIGYDKKCVVTGINIEAVKGQVLCLLGPNGSGKSTILRCLGGLLAPEKGTVLLEGKSLYSISPKDISKMVAVVLTERLSPGLITAFELTAMGRYPYTDFFGRLTKEDEEKIWEALRLVNAHELAERYFDELSDGEKQKVLIARAIAQEPEVIILDEPTTYLDVKHRLEVMRILRSLSKGKGITVVLSLHEIDIALKCCDKVFLIKKGKIVASGTPEDIINESTVAEVYDIRHAHYSSFLGGIEMCNKGETQVFVIAGGGSGTPLYRLLNKYGYSIITGVIHKNDIDYHVAKSLGALVISEKPFEEIGPEVVEKAVKLAQKCRFIVDSGYSVGTLNKRNLEILRRLIAEDKVVFSFRKEKEFETLYGGNMVKPIYCENISDLAERLNRVAI